MAPQGLSNCLWASVKLHDAAPYVLTAIPAVAQQAEGLPTFHAGTHYYLKSYLEGKGGVVSRLIAPITPIVTLLIPTINLLTESP